jgi:hypothetical protein
VPPSRGEVEAALALFSAAQLGGSIDRERRRVTIDAWVDDGPTVPPGSARRLLGALALLLALTAAWLRSPGGAVVAALPASLAAALLLGARAPLAASALGAAAAAVSALLLLARARALARAGAERGIALSFALRDAGRPSVALALLGCGLACFGSAPWLALATPLGVMVGLGLAPVLTRAFGAGVFARSAPLRAEVSPAVGSFQRRGTDARR